MRFCRIVTIALATVILAGSASTVDAQVKIGVVDLQRAINETEDGRQAKRRLKKVFDERQQSLNAAQESLKSQKESLERQQDVLSKEAFQKKVEKYQAILRRIGQTDGYTMIIEANEGGVVWVPANLDLTDVLIQRYNKQAKQGGAKKAK